LTGWSLTLADNLSRWSHAHGRRPACARSTASRAFGAYAETAPDALLIRKEASAASTWHGPATAAQAATAGSATLPSHTGSSRGRSTSPVKCSASPNGPHPQRHRHVFATLTRTRPSWPPRRHNGSSPASDWCPARRGWPRHFPLTAWRGLTYLPIAVERRGVSPSCEKSSFPQVHDDRPCHSEAKTHNRVHTAVPPHVTESVHPSRLSWTGNEE
jgi:hypothetical protein